jgi:chromosome segregation ATPase
LIQQQTLDNEQLQQKVKKLNSGFVGIDMERKRLVKAAHANQADLEKTQRKLNMKEMEVVYLTERVREQEMKLTSADADVSKLKSAMKSVLEESESILKAKEKYWEDTKASFVQQLSDREEKISTLSEDLSMSAKLNEEQSLAIDNLEQTLTSIRAEFNKAQLHHAQNLDNMEKELEAERHSHVETLEKLTSTREHLYEENGNLVEELQETKANYSSLQEDYRASVEAVKKVTNDLEQERRSNVDTREQLSAAKEQLVKDNHNLATELQKVQNELSSLHGDNLANVEATNSLMEELEMERRSHAVTQEELMTTRERLEKEKENLAEELQTITSQLQTTQVELQTTQDKWHGDAQTAHEQLQQHQSSSEKMKSKLQQEIFALKSQIERMDAESKNQQSITSEKTISLQKALDDEKATANKFRSQLRELNLQLKDCESATSNAMRDLERELGEARQKYEAVIASHQDEIQLVQKQHEDQVAEFETRGADVISDLEDTIASLQEEIMEGKVRYEESMTKMQQDLSNANMEQDRLARIIADHERRGAEQEEKIEALSLYGKQRKEEAKTLRSEIVRVQDALQNDIREKEDTIRTLRDELENTRSIHEQEMSDLRITMEDIRGQLVLAKDRLASEDGQLEFAKATLSDRTNLIREMVDQTKAYQNDLDRERNRAAQLEESVRSYKQQLAEAINSSHGLEEEIHEKDTQYCEAIRNERNQRKTVEAELESFRISMEDALRRKNETEKENAALKDKVQRQENYIGRLQDREKQNRRQQSAPRPSYMAGIEKEPPRLRNLSPSRSPLRVGSKIGAGLKQYQQENERPNVDYSISESANPNWL